MAALPQIIPLAAASSQLLQVTLGTQVCQIKVFSKGLPVPTIDPGEIYSNPPRYVNEDGVFLTLSVNDKPKVASVLCLNMVKIVRNSYIGFIGDLSFQDIVGNEPPQYTGLGVRWLLCYWPDL